MTLREAAALLGVQPATLRQQIAHRRLRARKLGSDWYVSTKEVARYDASRRRHSDIEILPADVEAFWSRVTKTDGCWTYHRDSGGYTTMVVHTDPPKAIKAHRFSWVLHNGPIPAGLYVCHRCDNPPCVRPDHLFLGTAIDNALDKVAKGRHHPRYRREHQGG